MQNSSRCSTWKYTRQCIDFGTLHEAHSYPHGQIHCHVLFCIWERKTFVRTTKKCTFPFFPLCPVQTNVKTQVLFISALLSVFLLSFSMNKPTFFHSFHALPFQVHFLNKSRKSKCVRKIVEVELQQAFCLWQRRTCAEHIWFHWWFDCLFKTIRNRFLWFLWPPSLFLVIAKSHLSFSRFRFLFLFWQNSKCSFECRVWPFFHTKWIGKIHQNPLITTESSFALI